MLLNSSMGCKSYRPSGYQAIRIQRSGKLTVTCGGVTNSHRVQLYDAISQQKVTVVLKVLFRLEFIDTQDLQNIGAQCNRCVEKKKDQKAQKKQATVGFAYASDT